MASINLDEIPTVQVLTTNSTVNIELVVGKFNLSYKTELSKMSRFFMSNNKIDGYKDKIAGWVLALERWVFGDGTTYLGFATKDMMDNNYLYISESNYYYKRLLTDENMESLCNEYAQKNMISALVENCREYGQNRATALANALALEASIMKSQTIMNDTNIQTTFQTTEAMGKAAEQITNALSEAAAAAEE